jgi:hypothetical protein
MIGASTKPEGQLKTSSADSLLLEASVDPRDYRWGTFTPQHHAMFGSFMSLAACAFMPPARVAFMGGFPGAAPWMMRGPCAPPAAAPGEASESRNPDRAAQLGNAIGHPVVAQSCVMASTPAVAPINVLQPGKEKVRGALTPLSRAEQGILQLQLRFICDSRHPRGQPGDNSPPAALRRSPPPPPPRSAAAPRGPQQQQRSSPRCLLSTRSSSAASASRSLGCSPSSPPPHPRLRQLSQS